MSSPMERRRTPRYECLLPATLSIITPEVTFSPHSLPSVLRDINQFGCRLTTDHISHDYYRVLIQELRHAKANVDLPDGRMLNLRGQIVWMDYNSKGASLGMMFAKMHDSQHEVLGNLLLELQSGGLITVRKPVLEPHHE